MDVRRFPMSQGWRIGKSAQYSTLQREFCREEPFSLVPFLLGSAKEMNSAIRPKALDPACLVFASRNPAKAKLTTRKVKRFRRGAAGNFSLIAPKKSHQKKGAFPDKSDTWSDAGIGIFRFAIHGSSENGAHPCAPPFGSGQ